jgi:hypothetical protein
MSLVQMMVRARGLDPVVDSACRALRVRLGFGERLAGVSRADLWEFEAASTAPGELVDRIVSATGLIVNPNRHRFAWRSVRPAAGEPGSEWGGAPSGAGRAFILIRPLGGGDEGALLRHLRHALGEGVVRGLGRADLWTLDIRGGEEDARRLACEAAVATSRRRGLLANPHCQKAAVHVGSLPLEPLERLLDGRVD